MINSYNSIELEIVQTVFAICSNIMTEIQMVCEPLQPLNFSFTAFYSCGYVANFGGITSGYPRKKTKALVLGSGKYYIFSFKLLLDSP